MFEVAALIERVISIAPEGDFTVHEVGNGEVCVMYYNAPESDGLVIYKGLPGEYEISPSEGGG